MFDLDPQDILDARKFAIELAYRWKRDGSGENHVDIANYIFDFLVKPLPLSPIEKDTLHE